MILERNLLKKEVDLWIGQYFEQYLYCVHIR